MKEDCPLSKSTKVLIMPNFERKDRNKAKNKIGKRRKSAVIQIEGISSEGIENIIKFYCFSCVVNF